VVLLHEVAHFWSATGRGILASHDRLWVSTYLLLVGWTLGKRMRAQLARCLQDRGVSGVAPARFANRSAVRRENGRRAFLPPPTGGEGRSLTAAVSFPQAVDGRPVAPSEGGPGVERGA
jgi:hypothetical protein